MNKDRRKAISQAAAEFADVMSEIEKLADRLDSVASDIEDCRDEEQEAFDNMSEGLQGSERGQAIESAAQNLDTITADLRQYIDNLACELDFEGIEG